MVPPKLEREKTLVKKSCGEETRSNDSTDERPKQAGAARCHMSRDRDRRTHTNGREHGLEDEVCLGDLIDVFKGRNRGDILNKPINGSQLRVHDHHQLLTHLLGLQRPIRLV